MQSVRAWYHKGPSSWSRFPHFMKSAAKRFIFVVSFEVLLSHRYVQYLQNIVQAHFAQHWDGQDLNKKIAMVPPSGQEWGLAAFPTSRRNAGDSRSKFNRAVWSDAEYKVCFIIPISDAGIWNMLENIYSKSCTQRGRKCKTFDKIKNTEQSASKLCGRTPENRRKAMNDCQPKEKKQKHTWA